MARLRDLLGYRTYAIRSDGAKFVNGVRDDNANTTWLTYQNGILTLGPGVYDELLFQRRFASDEEIVAWHKAGLFHDAETQIQGTYIANGAISTRHIRAGSVTAESAIIADAAIGTAQIKDAAVTNAKISDLDAGKITAGILRVTPTGGLGPSQVIVDDGASDRVVVGNISDRPWGTKNLASATYGIWGDQAGVYMRGYARLLLWGYAQDEDVIDLSNEPNLANPGILVAPKEMLTYSPQQPNAVPNIYTEAIEESTGKFRVKAKTIIKGAFTSWPGGWTSGNDRQGEWRQPQTAGPDGKKGVQTNFIQCRVYWYASAGYVIGVTQQVTNEFNSNGDPINWKTIRSFSHQGPLLGSHSGTLNWDVSLENGVWAIRVFWDGGNPPLATYATAEVRTDPPPGYRSDVYLNVDGISVAPNAPSGMSVMFIAYDQG